MSLEKINNALSNKYGCQLSDFENTGVKYSFNNNKLDISDYEAKITKEIDDIYKDLDSQKQEVKQILNVKDEENIDLLNSRTKIHDKAVEESKKLAKSDAINTVYGNTFLPNEFNRNAFSFVINLSKNPAEIQEISNAIKNKDKQKLINFFKDGVERCKIAADKSFENNNHEKILDNAIKYNSEYKVLAEMQPGKIEAIAEAFGITNDVKKEVANWLQDYGDICVTASLQRNYLSFYTSPLYPDMGLEKMYKNIEITDDLMESDAYYDLMKNHKLIDDTIKTISAEKKAFKSILGPSAIVDAQTEYERSFKYIKNHNKKDKENVILDENGKEINDNQIGKYMTSGKKVFVYDASGKYISSMKANPMNLGAFTYNSKAINVEKDENILNGLNELKKDLMQNNPKRLDDPKKEYTQIINKLDELTKNGLDKNKLREGLAKINELASKYMTDHKKAKGLTGIGEKRRNSIESIFNTCNKLSEDLGPIKNLETQKNKETNVNKKGIIVNEAKNAPTNTRDKHTQAEKNIAELMKANAMKKSNGATIGAK